MGFEWFVALRFLKEGRTQTALILTGVCFGVGTIVFLSALITGLQENIIGRTLGNQAHIVIRPPDEMPRVLAQPDEGSIDSRVIRPPERLRSIRQWQQVVDQVRAEPGVVAVEPTVNGPAFALRGNGTKAVAVRAIDPETYSSIVDLRSKMVEGTLDITGFETVLGVDLAKALGVIIGDKVRLLAGNGNTAIYRVAGTIDIGTRDLNERWVLVPLRAGQTLLGLDGGVSTIEVKITDIFNAEQVAQRIAAGTGLEATSWMASNSQLLIGLRSQSSSSAMIQVFVVLAVALGIASVLAVAVVQKSREIGIMMAYGTARAKILRIFLIQGGIVGLFGSVVGVALGIGLGAFFATLAKNPDGTATFPVVLRPGLYLQASLTASITGILAAVLPARRASRLDPATTIRNG